MVDSYIKSFQSLISSSANINKDCIVKKTAAVIIYDSRGLWLLVILIMI
jgi:hypothetical protein